MYQMGYIEKYGTGITENIRRMQEARLLAPEIDLSAEFVTTIWRDNDATNIGTNDATNDATNNATNDATNVATSKDYLAVNKRIIDRKVKKKVKKRMTEQQLQECIIEACYVEHSVEELAKLLGKPESHIRNRFITNMVADGILLRTKPEHSSGQTYMTNPKLDK
jgi:predicted HTH transcriptional regulator